MTPFQRKLAQRLGILLGQTLSYLIYRKLGAPRWAAVAVADTTGRLTSITIHLEDVNKAVNMERATKRS